MCFSAFSMNDPQTMWYLVLYIYIKFISFCKLIFFPPTAHCLSDFSLMHGDIVHSFNHHVVLHCIHDLKFTELVRSFLHPHYYKWYWGEYPYTCFWVETKKWSCSVKNTQVFNFPRHCQVVLYIGGGARLHVYVRMEVLMTMSLPCLKLLQQVPTALYNP